MGKALETEEALIIPEATDAELRETFDYAANYYLGISAEEFFRRLAAKEISDDDPRAEQVLYVMNFVLSATGKEIL
ncbi:MAG: hypothetical protein JO097_12080 [Acidobacteriaceae bacterium]|nr:hypothetical protein [Acidobacteriaceae bacterium]MBV9295499.1 hypothetical protein [Acidobacteriaceae bacterium]MBV9765545.1 hypothetical protein [Acidobacteriaceae bacterium]